MQSNRRLGTGIALVLMLALFSLFARAEQIVGSDDSDNNSFSVFPVWRGQLVGGPGDDHITGLNGNDVLIGGSGDDQLFGGLGRDSLYGESGADRLHGGYGERDTLVGGDGNDIYTVVDSRDLVREQPGGGQDRVHSFVNYSLPAEVEDLALMPDHRQQIAISGGDDGEPAVHFLADCAEHELDTPCRPLGTRAYGNSLNNLIMGNGLDNRLRGMSGNDTLFAGNGDDRLEGGSGDDVLAAFSADELWWTDEHDSLRGDAGADLFVIGISNRPGGLLTRIENLGELLLESERFPQYLGQGTVTIRDFDWKEGDKIEVYGDPGRYRIRYHYSARCPGHCAVIFWDGRADGFGSQEYVGKVLNIRKPEELNIPRDFL